MKKAFLFLSIILSHIVNAQQESKIKIDSGKKNIISVNQQNSDSIQNSDINLSHSDSNKIQVAQNGESKKDNGLPFYLKNTKTVISIILGLLAIGAYFMGRKRKKPKTKK
jgi:hypothetical protein